MAPAGTFLNMLNTQTIRDTLSAVLSDGGGHRDDNKPSTGNPYNVDKGTVMLETRIFNDTPIDALKCFDCLTKVVNLITVRGERLPNSDQSDLFFRITKLFQCRNDRLRRMVYLALKHLRISESEAFIVTSSITRDMNGSSDIHRSNAIRAMARVVQDPAAAAHAERFLKTSVVDKSPAVASAALCCGLALLETCPEMVKRWINEVTETVRSPSPMVQFHALALLHELKKGDRLALQKVIHGLTTATGNSKSPFGECLIIRYGADILKSRDRDLNFDREALMNFVTARLSHRSEMVVLEAARAIVDFLREKPSEKDFVDLDKCVSALQLMLSSQRGPVRYAAVRTLRTLAKLLPHTVARCNVELESLLSDSNRSVATLALTTLLTTGHESGVDRLIKQISLLMTDVPETFRMEVGAAVEQLGFAYPQKYRVVLGFLAQQLRDEGSYEVKKSLVKGIQNLMESLGPPGREAGLLHLCEFIEDCEYFQLCIQILSIIGHNAPETSQPSKFIRFIYNRLILENSAVRAAAVDALAHIAGRCPGSRKDICSLIEPNLRDSDDEVRERANIVYRALQSPHDPKTAQNVSNPQISQSHEAESENLPDTNSETTVDAQVPAKHVVDDDTSTEASSTLSLEELLDIRSLMSFSAEALLEKATAYIAAAESSTEFAGPFDVADIPTEAEYAKQKAAVSDVPTSLAGGGRDMPIQVPATGGPAAVPGVESPETQLPNMLISLLTEEFGEDAPLPALLHSSARQLITEQEAEYPVECVKHFLQSDLLVLEFIITNTMSDQQLTDISIEVGGFDTSFFQLLSSTMAPELQFEQAASCFVLFKRMAGPNVQVLQWNAAETFSPEVEDDTVTTEKLPLGSRTENLPVGNFSALMKCVVKETGDDLGYPDEYGLEPVSIVAADYVSAKPLRPGLFKSLWTGSLRTQGEYSVKVALNYKSLDACVEGIQSLLRGLVAVEESGTVPLNAANHSLLLSGMSPDGANVLVRAMLVFSPQANSCLVKVSFRPPGENRNICLLFLR